MATVNVYLTFNGDCEQAFNFYQSVFGGEFAHVGRFEDMPENPESPMSDSEKQKIMHIHFPISKETSLMGSDTGGEWASRFEQGNNFSISINAESKKEADRLFKGLSEDGQTTMPMDYTFWNSYFGTFTDKFGIQWMVSFNVDI